MRKWLIRGGVLALVVAGFFGIRRWFFAPEPLELQVARVTAGLVERTVTNSRAGTVKARRRAGLSTGTGGIVTALEVERGDRVESGQLLLRLDDEKQRSEVLYAEQQLAVAEARSAATCVAADRAKREWERNKKLSEEALVSDDTLDNLATAWDLARAECAVAAAEVELARAAVAVARAELSKTVLRAPFDAIVGDLAVEVGEWVTPSVPLVAAPDLIDAIDPSSLYVSAPMDEVDAMLLTPGQPVRITIDSHPDTEYWGRVVRLAPYVLDVEQQNRTLEIEVELDDAEFSATLIPGTSADVEVVIEARREVLRIPSHTLMEGGRVYSIVDESLVERVVETGLRNWNWTEVRGGLEEGELVVTSLDRPGVAVGAEARVESVDVEP